MYPLDLATSGKGEPEVKALCFKSWSKKNDFVLCEFWIINWYVFDTTGHK